MKNAILTSIRNINKAKNCNTLYNELGLLKLEDLFKLELAKFMYKVKYQLLPVEINGVFQQQPRRYNTRNRNIPDIAQSFPNFLIIAFW